MLLQSLGPLPHVVIRSLDERCARDERLAASLRRAREPSLEIFPPDLAEDGNEELVEVALVNEALDGAGGEESQLRTDQRVPKGRCEDARGLRESQDREGCAGEERVTAEGHFVVEEGDLVAV